MKHTQKYSITKKNKKHNNPKINCHFKRTCLDIFGEKAASDKNSIFQKW